MGYLIDNNAVIDYLGGLMPQSGMSFMNNIINAPVILQGKQVIFYVNFGHSCKT
jgi:hypothetical protein